MFDAYLVEFNDGSSTTFYVDQDDEIQDALVALCDQEGWNVDDITGYFMIEANIEPGG